MKEKFEKIMDYCKENSVELVGAFTGVFYILIMVKSFKWFNLSSKNLKLKNEFLSKQLGK